MEIRFLNLCVPSAAKKLGEYTLNDIVEVMENAEVYYRIYLNNEESYVKIPEDSIMLSEIKNKTWTLDNKEKISKLVKCGVEDCYLSEILKRYGHKEYDYEVYKNSVNEIPKELYRKKRLEFREM